MFEKSLQLKKSILLRLLTNCFGLEQFVLVLVSVYNRTSLNTKSFPKQELPKYIADEFCTYQADSLKKENFQKLFAQADSVVDKIWSCPRIKPLNSQTWIFDSVETGVLSSVFAQQLRRKSAEVPDIYFTLLDAAGTSPNPVLNQSPKTKGRGR